MAICNIIDDPDRTQEQYEEISAHVRASGPTTEQRDRFLAERLGPAYEAVGHSLNDVTRTQFEVDMLVAGDLAGVSQQPAGAEA
jgi:hypothetical protein